MNKKGFTLIEMIAVVIIVSLLSIIMVPMIINQVSDKKKDVNATTEEIIFQAAQLYMENDINTYSKTSGNSYFVSLDKIINAGYLSSPIIDYTTGKEIPLTKCVYTKVNNYKEYDDFKLSDC